MGGDKVRPSEAIAIEEDAQRPPARTNASIANLAAAEAAVLLTHMLKLNGETWLPALDETRGLGPGAVVGCTFSEVFWSQ